MISFTCGIMAQMNLLTKQKQVHRHAEQTCDFQGGGEEGKGWLKSLGLAGTNYYTCMCYLITLQYARNVTQRCKPTINEMHFKNIKKRTELYGCLGPGPSWVLRK